MDILEDLRKIIERDGHYLTVLNEINGYLLHGGYVKYSAFFFHRGGKDYLIASVGEWSMVETRKLELFRKKGKLLGYWLFDSELPLSLFEETARLLKESIFFDEWEHSYSFNQNRGCEYFPCHEVKDENRFSCLFCYCPLYLIPDCGGSYSLLENGMKDCSKCLLPHREESYEYIISRLKGARSS